MSDVNKKPAKSAENGKGDAPRNNFSQVYRANYDAILWKSKNKETKKEKPNQYPRNRGN